MYPNSALSVGQIVLVAAVTLLALAIWIVGVFVAAREPRQREGGAAATSLPQRPQATDESEPKAA